MDLDKIFFTQQSQEKFFLKKLPRNICGSEALVELEQCFIRFKFQTLVFLRAVKDWKSYSKSPK